MKKVLLFVLMAAAVNAHAQTPEMKLVLEAANALGGKERILAVKTLQIFGYGQQAYQNGGGNITESPDAPQKWINVNGLARTIDLDRGRMHLQQRLVQDFVFAYARNMNGDTRVNQFLDGDIAFNIGADGRAVARLKRLFARDASRCSAIPSRSVKTTIDLANAAAQNAVESRGDRPKT